MRGALTAAASCAVVLFASACTAGTAAHHPGRAQSAVRKLLGTWGAPQEVPGLAALVGTGTAQLTSVSCASPGNCGAGGYYARSSVSEAFVVSQVNGVWGRAMVVPGIVALSHGRGSQLTSVSCASPGNCSAGGSYTTGIYSPGGAVMYSAFEVSEVDGRWGTAREVSGVATLDGGRRAALTSVSCASAGNCSAGGYYSPAPTGHTAGFVVSQIAGVWGNARAVRPMPAIGQVSCATAGNCGAAGGHVLSQVGGVWGIAQAVAPAASSFGRANMTLASCASPGNCTAGGQGMKEARAVVASEVNGVWGSARQIPGAQKLMAKSKSSLLSSVSCAVPGTCLAGGYAFRSVPQGSSTREYGVAFVAAQRNGAWSAAQPVPGLGKLSRAGFSLVSAVSCAAPGRCEIAGAYTTSDYNPDGLSGPDQVFVDGEIDGSWDVPADVTSVLGNDGTALITSLSCPAVGMCTAVGYYFRKDQQRAFVMSQVR